MSKQEPYPNLMDARFASYAQALRQRIEFRMGELFSNNDADYAAIIMREFLSAARDYVFIYEDHFSNQIFGRLQAAFADALARGVDVRVLTSGPMGKVEAKDVAGYLYEHKAFRLCSIAQAPAFMVADSLMFRLETDMETHQALACAYASEPEPSHASDFEYGINREIVKKLHADFLQMWSRASRC